MSTTPSPSKSKKNESLPTFVKFENYWKNVWTTEEFGNRFPSEIFQDYVVSKRWYGGKVSTIKNIEIIDHIHLSSELHNYYGLLIEVNFEESFFQNYFITVGFMLEHELKV